MAYDERLAQRVREALSGRPGLAEKKMFGGVGFLLHGNMCCGVHGESLIVRVGPERHPEALAKPYARPFDLTGRAMAGWVVVDPKGCQSHEALVDWIQQGMEFAQSLPGKGISHPEQASA